MKDPGVEDYRDQILKCLQQDTTTYKDQRESGRDPYPEAYRLSRGISVRSNLGGKEKNGWQGRTRKGEIRLSYGCPKTGAHQLKVVNFDPNYLHNVCFF